MYFVFIIAPIKQNCISISLLLETVFYDLFVKHCFFIISNIKWYFFFGQMHNMNSSELNARVDYLLKTVGLEKDKDKKVKAFSTGMRKRISLAIAMVHNPEILFLDEPTSGLDPQNVINVMSVIQKLAQDNGVTVFLCTHQLRYAQDLCTLYGFIKNGNLLGTGTFEELAKRKNACLRVKIKGANIPNISGLHREEEFYVKDIRNEQEVGSLIRNIVNDGGDIYEVIQDRWSLEQLYFKYVNEK
ncbi:MAG TPA: ABC transporter ATP-binding protein [Lachnospiraceae bacterium]|nr:ABC transporter ATP-binding protein [Lachnospiraceae bacterium]